MAGLWRQLILGHPISLAVKNLYRRHHERRTRPSLRDVMEVLQLQICQYSESNVFVIIDALDECTEENNVRQTVLRELRSILPKVHLMVTSRPHINIISDIPELIQLEICATDGDLRRYVNERMYHDHQLAKNIKMDATLPQDILNAVVSKAEGRYVSSTSSYIDFTSRPDFHLKILASQTSYGFISYSNLSRRHSWRFVDSTYGTAWYLRSSHGEN
jgi:hypothetical protein